MYKKIIKGKKAVFFDLDGTVVKQTPKIMSQTIQNILDNYIHASYVNVADYNFSGIATSRIWEAILKTNTFATKYEIKDLLERTFKEYLEVLAKTDIEVTEGFWDFIYELKEEKKMKIALITSTPKEIAIPVADKLGITKIFDLILCGNDVKKPKPDPEIYKKALKMLKLRPKDATVFEDSLTGVSSAAAAKIDIVVMYNHKTPKHEFPGNILFFVDDFSDLPGKLDEDWNEYMVRRAKETAKEIEENPDLYLKDKKL